MIRNVSALLPSTLASSRISRFKADPFWAIVCAIASLTITTRSRSDCSSRVNGLPSTNGTRSASKYDSEITANGDVRPTDDSDSLSASHRVVAPPSNGDGDENATPETSSINAKVSIKADTWSPD